MYTYINSHSNNVEILNAEKTRYKWSTTSSTSTQGNYPLHTQSHMLSRHQQCNMIVKNVCANMHMRIPSIIHVMQNWWILLGHSFIPILWVRHTWNSQEEYHGHHGKLCDDHVRTCNWFSVLGLYLVSQDIINFYLPFIPSAAVTTIYFVIFDLKLDYFYSCSITLSVTAMLSNCCESTIFLNITWLIWIKWDHFSTLLHISSRFVSNTGFKSLRNHQTPLHWQTNSQSQVTSIHLGCSIVLRTRVQHGLSLLQHYLLLGELVNITGESL